MTEVWIATGHGEMPTYVASPAGDGPCPGVVVLHDFTGMSHDLRNQADWLAGEGYLAAAPDLYYWGSRLTCLRTIIRDMGARRGRTFDDIAAVRGWLAGQERCTGRIGVIGFCMGGGYVATRCCSPPGTGTRRRARTTAAARRTPSGCSPAPAPSSPAMGRRTARRWAPRPRRGWSARSRPWGWTTTSWCIPGSGTAS